MAKKSKTDQFRAMLSQRDREERDVAIYNQFKAAGLNLFAAAIRVGAAAKLIKDEEIFKRITGDDKVTFDQFCAFELPQVKTTTIKRYIMAAELLESWGVNISPDNKELDGYAVNKVLLLKSCNKPGKYFDAMTKMPFQDFKKYIEEKEHGVVPADDEIPQHIAREQAKQHEGCPLWVWDKAKKKMCCKEGIV